MIKLLFIINSLTIGGSEKSLISLLNAIDYSKYKVDLLMLKTGESFDKYIPRSVNILEVPEYYKYLAGDLKKIGIFKRIRFRLVRTKCSIELRQNAKNKIIRNNQQIFYSNQKNVLKELNNRYDVAIAYAQGFPTYFLADKIKANKKIAWINCDYSSTMYDKKEDKCFYDKIDKIVAVSQAGKESIISVNNEYSNKTEVIKDIVNPRLIMKMADEAISDMNTEDFKIVTVARLVMGYKGYDLAIKACRTLKDQGLNFKWYIVGEGPDRKKIEELIRYEGITDRFILLGSRDNPYPYMKNCDLYVQPSRKEGFGLTVVEAKILKKPIISTNFSSVYEIIKNGVDGVIVNTHFFELYKAIVKMMTNKKMYKEICNKLELEQAYNSVDEIDKIYNLIEG